VLWRLLLLIVVCRCMWLSSAVLVAQWFAPWITICLSLSLSLSASRSDFLFALSIPSRALYTLFVRDVLTSTSSSSLLVVLLPAAVTESCCARMLRVPSPTCGTE